MGIGGMNKGHMQIIVSDVDGVGIYKGGDIFILEKIAILLSGNILFTDILNETTHNCYDHVQNPIIQIGSNRNIKLMIRISGLQSYSDCNCEQ